MGGQGTQSKRKAPNGCKEFFLLIKRSFFPLSIKLPFILIKLLRKEKAV
jgi:hypothetical protein